MEPDAVQAPAKRRRTAKAKAKESVYVKREAAPYIHAIRPLRQDVHDAVNRDVPEAIPIAESSEMAAERSRREDYQARARKAWETKRRRQKERFEQLEASALHVASGDVLSTNQRKLPDGAPNDDLLRSLHTYASRYYTSNGLLLPPALSSSARRRQAAALQASGNDRAAATDPADSSSDDDYGSVYRDSEDDGDVDGGTSTRRSSPRPSQMPEEAYEGPKKAGGQRGKRILKDMYLALDGSALLALGAMLQEQIIARIKAEGFVPKAIERHNEIQSDFELSADEDEDDEEGSGY